MTPTVPLFPWILLTNSQIKEKIGNFKNISKGGCHKNEVDQNNWQRMGLLPFILQHKKKIRGHETLTHTFTKRIEEKTNQNKNFKKIDTKKKRIQEKRQKQQQQQEI